ncbi:hypothetical protein FQN57_001583 [Myotisia sp. PD_48]|nr:hypothetical protein FQN57_001583 [Myotisia sp. PD_48]
MKKILALLSLAICTLPGPTFAFIGLGIEMYHPSCAFACRAAIASAPLSCSTHGEGEHSKAQTTPDCRAGNTPFLTTLAWCMNSTCDPSTVSTWQLEKYWREKATGGVTVLPKWSYVEAIHQVANPPSREWEGDAHNTLNFTAIVPHHSWESQKLTLEYFEYQESAHAKYGLILLIVGMGIPIVMTLLGYVPYMTSVLDRLKPNFIYPSTVGKYHIQSLPYLLGNPPTMGQGIYILIFFILNVVLSAIDYSATQPNTMFDTTYQEIMGYISCRTGVIAFALAPLVILFSGRNNILLWVTNWSHSTYMLLHRWVARIFTIQVIVHSIVELVLYIDKGTYEEELVTGYWIWGCVATVACSAMLIFSLLWVRRLSYEFFVTLHILLAIFVLVGSWYHVELLFKRRWGYELWLYAAFAVWGFDWIIRGLRIAKAGFRRAKIVEVSEGYVRMDIEGIRWTAQPGYHAYIHFPTLSPWAPWQSHPFSVIPTSMLYLGDGSETEVSRTSADENDETISRDIEKAEMADRANTNASAIHQTTTRKRSKTAPYTTAGTSFYIRKSAGITKRLKQHARLPTFLDGPYRGSPAKDILACDRVLLIGGGVGITGLLPFVGAHTNVKLFWSMKECAAGIAKDLQLVTEVVENDIRIGKRLDINGLLEEEAENCWKKVGVVVCGPGGLCDDVRAAVVRLGRETKCVFELEVYAFSW